MRRSRKPGQLKDISVPPNHENDTAKKEIESGKRTRSQLKAEVENYMTDFATESLCVCVCVCVWCVCMVCVCVCVCVCGVCVCVVCVCMCVCVVCGVCVCVWCVCVWNNQTLYSMSAQSFYGKRPHLILQEGASGERGKITVSGIPNCQQYCEIFIEYAYITNVAAGRIIQPCDPRVGYRCT